MNCVYFLTGATGTLGSEILRVLLKDDTNTVYCLVRDSLTKEYQFRLNYVLAENGYPVNKQNVIGLKGDIRNHNLGLSEEVYGELSRCVTHIIHCAADIRFTHVIDELKLSNVEGTRNILELAKACRDLNPEFRVLSYVSSAYIAGHKTGVVIESELTDEHGFRNNYEKTKYEAESLVKAYMDQGIPAIVFRPSVIFGSSESGKVLKTNVLFPFLMLYSKVRLPSILPEYKDTVLDVVPVDYVAKAICHISLNNPENINKCFHIAAGPKKSMSKNYLIRMLLKEMTGKRRIYVPHQKWEDIMKAYPKFYKNRKKLSFMASYLGYDKYSDTVNPLFSVSETEEALKKTGIALPANMNKYIKLCVDYSKEKYFNQIKT